MSDKLANLYAEIDNCKNCKAAGNKLRHMHGFGALRPEWMLVLVNATHRNISSAPDYSGPRFPFIGVGQFWHVLANGGFISKQIARNLPGRKDWRRADTEAVQKQLIKNKLFLTNIVKCCYAHSAYPSAEIIAGQPGFLKREISIVRPRRIVAFGGLVAKVLTGQSVKLSECAGGKFFEIISGLRTPVSPVYFPIGRGSPKKSAAALRNLSGGSALRRFSAERIA